MSQRNTMSLSLTRTGFGRTSLGYSTPVFMNPLTPGSTPAPVTPGIAGGGGLSGDPYSTLTNAGCNLIPNAALRAACIAASGLFRPGGNSSSSGGGGAGAGGLQPVACPEGYSWDGTQCRTTGVGRYLPGDIGTPDVAWNAVNGRYGAGVVPVEVPRSIARCPTGYVLGKDGICYDRLRKTDRMWNPGTKPLFTGGDVAALRRAKSLKKRLQAAQKLFPKAAPKAGRTRRKR